MNLNNLTTDDLRSFIVHLRDQRLKYKRHQYRRPVQGNLSDFTVAGYVRVLRRFCRWLELNGHTEQNIASRLKKPPLPKLPPKDASVADIRAPLDACDKSSKYPKRDRAIILTLSDTGCRKAGLIGLRLSDLSLESASAMVREKGRKARIVFLSPATKAALQEWLAERPARTDFVFVGQRGPLGDYAVNQILQRLKRHAGIVGRVNPHSFRHAFAKMYLNNGGDLGSLADLMGHASVQVTKDTYSIFLTEELRRKHDLHSPLQGIV